MFIEQKIAEQFCFCSKGLVFLRTSGRILTLVQVLLLLQNTLNAHGAGQLTVSKLIPNILTSTSDPQSAVRDAAIETLVEIYRFVD